MPGIAVDAGDTSVSRTDTVPIFMKFIALRQIMNIKCEDSEKP